MSMNQIVNANVYVNGSSMLGRAKEVKLPEIAAITNEHKALGMVGTTEIFAGFEKLEAEIQWNSYYSDIWKTILNPMSNVQIMLRSNLQTADAAGIVQELPMVTMMTVMFKKNAAGTYKPQEAAEFPTSLAVYNIVQKVNGIEVLAFDPTNNIYRVDGKDLLSKYRANIGG